MQLDSLLLESHYLPCLEYFVLLGKSDEVILHDDEHFQKQSFRNRCYVLGANKVQLLTVPVRHGNVRHGNVQHEGSSRKMKIKDVMIDYSQAWYLEHLATLQSAYGKAPYYEYYIDYFKEILLRKEKYLWDLNWQMLTLCLELVKNDRSVGVLADSKVTLSSLNNSFYNQISRKKPFSDRKIYKETSYQQLFGSNFVPNLSIIDLLFCEGPNSSSIISQSTIRDI